MTVVIVSATPETHVLIRQTSSDWLRIRRTSSDWLELHALTHAAVRDAADSQETNVPVVIASATLETSVLIRQTSSDWLELHALTHAAVCDAADSQETNVTVVIVSATPETRVLIGRGTLDEPPRRSESSPQAPVLWSREAERHGEGSWHTSGAARGLLQLLGWPKPLRFPRLAASRTTWSI